MAGASWARVLCSVQKFREGRVVFPARRLAAAAAQESSLLAECRLMAESHQAPVLYPVEERPPPEQPVSPARMWTARSLELREASDPADLVVVFVHPADFAGRSRRPAV